MKITTKLLTRSALILALAIAVQSVKMPQFVTGPLINTLLFLAAGLVGPLSGVLVGVFTPIIAFAMGIMPLAPAIPVIVIGNASLALVFGLLQKNQYLGMFAASVVKYALMSLGVYFLLPVIMGVNLPPKVVTTLTTTQLLTAVGGGVVALIILKALPLLSKDRSADVVK